MLSHISLHEALEALPRSHYEGWLPLLGLALTCSSPAFSLADERPSSKVEAGTRAPSATTPPRSHP